MEFREILSKLENVKKVGKGYSTRCPAHDDKQNSLSVTEKDGGGTLIHCHAGCETKSVCYSLGIEEKDLFRTISPSPKRRSQEVASYPYRDENGNHKYDVVRYEPKDFKFRRFENGKMQWGLNGQPRLLYRLPELIQAIKNGNNEVFLVEGEKDVENVRTLGLTATNLRDFRKEFVPYLKDTVITILTDHDPAGFQFAEDVRTIIGSNAKVKVVDLFEAEPLPANKGKDVSDWINLQRAEGNDGAKICETLRAIVEQAKDTVRTFDLDQKRSSGILEIKSANDWMKDARTQPTQESICDPLVLDRQLAVLFGDTGSNKSTFAVQIGQSVASGIPIPGFAMTAKPQKTLFLDFELSELQFRKRYTDENGKEFTFSENFSRATLGRPDQDGFVMESEAILFDSIKAAIVNQGFTFVIVDNITYLATQTETAKDALPLMKVLNRLKLQLPVTILVIGHTPKRDSSRPFDLNDLQGSKMISNFADSVFAIGKSANDASIRYIKQLKQRDSEPTLDSDNVAILRVRKENSFLGLEFLKFEPESRHLVRNAERAGALDEACEFLLDVLTAGPKSSIKVQELAMQRRISSTTLTRAKSKLGVKSKKSGFADGWEWEMPEKLPD